MATTYTKTCGRCSGKGVIGNLGWCFDCDGARVVTVTRYTAAEKADMRARGERRIAALEAVRAGAKRIDTDRGTSIIDPAGLLHDWSRWGFDRLESTEPERFAKMLDSIDAGRLYEVIIALADYAKAHAR
jgi:hypothetical protein